jgi:hypothetical protein
VSKAVCRCISIKQQSSSDSIKQQGGSGRQCCGAWSLL